MISNLPLMLLDLLPIKGNENMELQIGDLVRVVNKECEAYGLIGKIVDIDLNWICPYELEFANGQKFEQELYSEKDVYLKIETLSPALSNLQDEFINIKWQNYSFGEEGSRNGAEFIDVVRMLISEMRFIGSMNIANFPHREFALSITKLEEAEMWLERYDSLLEE